MSLLAKDISKYQGAWVNTGEPIYFIKISGGDAGLYIDPDAATNYNQTVAAGIAFAGYHFAGGTDPIVEANYYLNAMKPWNPGEVPVVDWEVQHADPVGWVLAFVTHVHDVAGAWPIVYINRSTLMAYDWSPVLANCALWLADWVGQPDANIDTGNYTYTVLQYNDGPNYDHDVVYVETVEQFKKFGWPSPTAPLPETSTSSTSSSTSTTSTTTTSTTTTLPTASTGGTVIDVVKPVVAPKPPQVTSPVVSILEKEKSMSLQQLQVLTKHLPIVAAVVIAIINILLGSHNLHLAPAAVDQLNGILIAIGLSSLHVNSL